MPAFCRNPKAQAADSSLSTVCADDLSFLFAGLCAGDLSGLPVEHPMQNTMPPKNGPMETLRADARVRLLVFGTLGLSIVGAFAAHDVLSRTRSRVV
jgi:hypothetical protein